MTPHFPKWYGGEQVNPDDAESPRPIPFLSIAAGSSFEVAMLVTASGNAGGLGAVEDDLRLGLEEMGLGAKTAAGYGVFGVEVLLPPPITSTNTPSRQSSAEPIPGPSHPLQAPLGQPEPSNSTPRRNPHVVEAEALIQSMRAHEIKGRLQSVAEAIGRCPTEERERLVAEFRKRQEALGSKTKDIGAVMESLGRRLAALAHKQP
jgi:hypothetical protein